MMEYMMIFRNDKMDDREMPGAEQMQAILEQWQTWIKEIALKNKFSSTNQLDVEGRTIKPGNLIIDGPYAEIKEIVGGYLVVKADSLDETIEMAKSCPGVMYGGSVEVRKVIPMQVDFNSPVS